MAREKEQIRLFVGVRVSLATVNALADAARDLRARAGESGLRVKWVAPATYHVTLKFIGWTRPAAVDAIHDSVGSALAGTIGFEFATRGVGAFPSPRKARVVWAGVDDPNGHLTALAEAVDATLASLGYAKEKRPFHPHVTLGRLKVPGDISALLEPLAEQSFSETVAESVVLFESVMKSSGAEYTPIVEWPLEAAPRAKKRQTERLEPSSADASREEDANGSRERFD